MNRNIRTAQGNRSMNKFSAANLFGASSPYSKDRILSAAGISFCVFAFIIALIRSAVTAITYDEATTYLFFYQENLFDPAVLRWYFTTDGCVANNHWLNTFLIYIVCKLTDIKFSEFMIRFPILMLYAVYLFAVCRAYKKSLIPFPVLILLAGNYYLNEFYGLARGYGMANTFVFLFCIRYIQWKRSDFREMKYLNLAMIDAMLATFSNTIVLLLYPAVGCVCLYRLITKKQFGAFARKCGLIFLVLIGFSILMVIYHFNISSEGKPLYTGTHNFFDSFVKGYVNMFIFGKNMITAVSVLIIAVLLVCVLRINRGMKDLDLALMMILFIAANFVMHFITHKGYIATRILLPFYAFMVLSVSEIIQTALSLPVISGKVIPQNAKNIAGAVLCVACVWIFAGQINLHGTKDWKNDYRYRVLENGSAMTGITHNGMQDHPANEFYIKKNEAVIEEFYSYMR